MTRCQLSKSKSWKKTCWQKKPCWQTKDRIWLWWLSERYQHPDNQPIQVYIYEVRLFDRACSCRYHLLKNNSEWTTSAPTTSPCEVRLFELAVIVLYYLICYEKQHKILANLENFVLGKRFLDKNERKSKYRLSIIAEKQHFISYLASFQPRLSVFHITV